MRVIIMEVGKRPWNKAFEMSTDLGVECNPIEEAEKHMTANDDGPSIFLGNLSRSFQKYLEASQYIHGLETGVNDTESATQLVKNTEILLRSMQMDLKHLVEVNTTITRRIKGLSVAVQAAEADLERYRKMERNLQIKYYDVQLSGASTLHNKVDIAQGMQIRLMLLVDPFAVASGYEVSYETREKIKGALDVLGYMLGLKSMWGNPNACLACEPVITFDKIPAKDSQTLARAMSAPSSVVLDTLDHRVSNFKSRLLPTVLKNVPQIDVIRRASVVSDDLM